MGCYGIGNTRLVGTLVELFHDEKGIVWPAQVAPFAVHLISLPGGEAHAQHVYETLKKEGIEVLWDDRNAGAGTKFADADLLGIPFRFVISAKTGERIEVRKRTQAESELVDLSQVIEAVKNLT